MNSLDQLKRHRVAFLLLLLIYLNLTWSIVSAEWSEGLAVLQWIAGLATLLGFLLAISRWPAFVSGLYSLVAGFLSILLLMCARLSPELAWSDRVMEVGLRVRQWAGILFSGAVNYDNLVFVLQLAVYVWIFCSLSTWRLFRRGQVWWAIAPPGVGLLINLYYAPPKLYAYFVVYLMLALVLIVRINFQRRETEWTRRRITYTSDVSFDFLRDGVVIALLVVVLAWVLPGKTDVDALTRIGDRLEHPLSTLQAEWNRMFASLTSHVTREEIAFGRYMTFSGAVHLGDTPVMDITADEGRYWRAVAYDFYGGRGWASTYEELGPMGESASPIAPPPYQLRIDLEQTVQVLMPSTHSIVAAALPYELDVSSEAVLTYLPRDGATAARPPADVELIYSQYRLREGDTYHVVSSISKADAQSLREAGDAYPEWVREYYLQLPPDLPRRVHTLAANITRGLENNYDRAAALEGYLRQITYNEQIESAPPPTEDAVDHFLFEMREGYCDYYASAMAVLARSAGIPARVVQGYAEDEKLEGTSTFHLQEEDGHAWVELFFPRYGWIEFEPTAAESVILRPERQLVPLPDHTEDLPGTDGLGDDTLPEDKFGPEDDILGDLNNLSQGERMLIQLRAIARTVGAVVLILIALIASIWLVLRLLEPRRMTPPQRAYFRMSRFARTLIAAPPDSRQTPFEYGRLLALQVPYADEEIRALVGLYVQDRFAARLPAEDAARASPLWRRVLPKMVRRSGERVLENLANRLRQIWWAIRRLTRPRAPDGRYAG